MARYLDVKQDDELFAARLQEVNREMDSLLHKTSRTRHSIDRTAAEIHMGVPLNFHRGEVSDASYKHGCSGVPGLNSSALHSNSALDGAVTNAMRDDLTRGVVSAELSQWARTHLPTLVAPLVEAQVQRHLQGLREAVADVQQRQADVEQRVTETVEQLRVHRREMQVGLAALQRGVAQDVDEHQRLVERRVGDVREAVQRVKGEVDAAQAQRREEADRLERRVEEAVQRRQLEVRDTFADLERELRRWRQSVQQEVERDAQAVRAQHGALEGHVAQLQGALTSTADVAARCSAELQRVMEDAVSRASEVRLCRGDVNRLEMLVQCSALQGLSSPNAPVRTRKRSASSSGGKANKAAASGDVEGREGKELSALQPGVALTAEVAHLNDVVQAVVARMDGLDRQVRQLDVAIARGAAAASVPRSSFFDAARDFGEESFNARSAASTRRPSNSQLSSIHTGRGGTNSFRQLPNPSSVPSYDGSGNRYSSGGSDGQHPGRSEWSSNHNATSFLNPVAQPTLTGPYPNNNGGPRRVEAVSMRAGPEPSAFYHPPTSHLSNDSAPPFEDDDAEDPHPMPVVVSDTRAAPGAMSAGVVASHGFAAARREGSASPPQRRAPPRVIPIEAAPAPQTSGTASATTFSKPVGVSASGGGEHGGASNSANFRLESSANSTHRAAGPPGASAAGRSVHSGTGSNRQLHYDRASSDEGSESERSSAKSGGSGGDSAAQSPFSYSLDRYGGTYGANHSTGSGGQPATSVAHAGEKEEEEKEAAAAAAAPSASDSYVSDTPAAADASADGSYVSDTPPLAAAGASVSQDRFGRYTPAPASDSEEERDNEVISRSALD